MAGKTSSLKQADPFAEIKALNREKKARYEAAMKDADKLVEIARRHKKHGLTYAIWTEACAHAFFYEGGKLPRRST